MNIEPINAMPTKKLFIDTLVRDVSLIDAVLDLVDNAIDGYIRSGYKEQKDIRIRITDASFDIWDNCGGIDIKYAQNEVFRFGIEKDRSQDTLGVYGIGLKRSMFKIGRQVIFESDDQKKYFRIKINIDEWEKDPEWKFGWDQISDTSGERFTKINIQSFTDKTGLEINTDKFKNELKVRISKTYFLFLKEKVNISLNGNKIEPFELKLGLSEETQPAVKIFRLDDVDVKIKAGAHPEIQGAGWYIFCNDRLIVAGDKTELTGWGRRGVPIFHPKHNRFKGFVFLHSSDPAKLPWNTAKNGLDISSTIYLRILDEMQTIMQQYTKFMNKAYPTEKEDTIGKDILGSLHEISLSELDENQDFKPPDIPKKPNHITITYKKLRNDVDRIKKCMGNISISNTEVGKRTFDYYKEMECSDDE